jgi:toxin ParE1/3/4
VSRFALTSSALHDLAAIDDYVRAESPAAADRLLASLQATFALLATNPAMGRRRDELRPGLRSFPVGTYVAFYRIVGDVVEIVRVLHGRRDIERELQP